MKVIGIILVIMLSTGVLISAYESHNNLKEVSRLEDVASRLQMTISEDHKQIRDLKKELKKAKRWEILAELKKEEFSRLTGDWFYEEATRRFLVNIKNPENVFYGFWDPSGAIHQMSKEDWKFLRKGFREILLEVKTSDKELKELELRLQRRGK